MQCNPCAIEASPVLRDGDTLVLEQNTTGTVLDDILGVPRRGRLDTLRVLHVFSLRDGLVCREQVRSVVSRS
jgi:hypothetical protein